MEEAIGVIHKAFEAAIEKSNFDILSVILDASKKLDGIVKTGSLQECYMCINLAFWYIPLQQRANLIIVNPYSPDGIKNKLSKSWFEPVKIGTI